MRIDDVMRALAILQKQWERRAMRPDTLGVGEYIKGVAAGVQMARLHVIEVVKEWRGVQNGKRP